MKLTALAFILVLTGCGRISTTETSSIFNLEPRSLTAQPVSSEVASAVSAACNALSQKAAVLPSAINTTHSFSSSQVDCDGNKLASNLDVVTIQGNSTNGFIFRKQTGLEFIFPDVETPDNGIFEDICPGVSSGNLQSPIVTGSTATYVGPSVTCPQVPGEVCIEIVKATPNGSVAQPHTREIIRIRTRTDIGKVGFWTFRTRETSSFCSEGKSITLSATLK